MKDFQLAFDPDGFLDLVVEEDDLVLDDGIQSAVLISLFSDARLPEDEESPDGSGDPRGWWAEDTGDPYGSLLWTLERSKLTTETARLAEQYAEEALAWMLADNVAASVDVVGSIADGRYLLLEITIERGTDPDHEDRWASLEATSFRIGTAAVNLMFRS